MHLPPLISDLAIILGVAALVTLLFHKIRQPVVLGYLIAGVIISPHTPTGLTVSDLPSIQVWAELGVIFLMFALGLEFTFHKLTRVGSNALGTTVINVGVMLIMGIVTGQALGWSKMDSLFLGGILSISSTTIIIKAFEDLGLKTRRFAEMVVGVLIVEDLFAILMLIAFSTIAAKSGLAGTELLISAGKLVLVVGGWFLVGYFVLPLFLRSTARFLSNETLTVLCVGLCLGLVVLASRFDYSTALGAFIMGSILAETSESHRIETLIHPLKDLFAAVFFVSVGMFVNPKILFENLTPILIITAVVIVGKIISVTMGALIVGQPIKRSVQVGLSLAQIGEFSFIIATLGQTLKVTSDFLYPIAVAVSVVTTFTTPFLIRFSDKFATAIEKALPEKMHARLERYSSWRQSPVNRSDEDKIAFLQLTRFFLNGILVTLIFWTVSELGLSYLESISADLFVRHLLGWIVALLFAAPFLWGMFFAFNKGSATAFIFFGHLATIGWLGVLSTVFFPVRISLIATIGFAGILFLFFYRRLKTSYLWLEKQLVTNLRGSLEIKTPDSMERLVPWDLHLTRLNLHPNSNLAGLKLREAQIRARFGLNVVGIQRGNEVIVAPSADERLLPKDEVLVLGTDEQIEPFRKSVETPVYQNDRARKLADYSLRPIFIHENSPFIGQTLQNSQVREKLQGLVVGLERGNFRSTNPDPTTDLRVGDVLWVVSGLA